MNPPMWAQSNPRLEIRVSPQDVADDRRGLDARSFALERLVAGDWPDTEPCKPGAGR